MPSRSLLVLRPLVLALALPLGAAACLSALEGTPRVAPAAAPAPAAPAAPRWVVWISNEGSGDVTLVDTATDEIIATLPVGKRPRGIRTGPGGERVFVALSGSPRQGPPSARAARLTAVEAADRSADGIAVVDVAARRLVTVLPGGRDPETFDLLPDGRTLVVSHEETAAASYVDVETARVLRTVAVGEEPEGVTVSPDGSLVAVTSERDHRVDLLDRDGRPVARVPTCDRPRSLVFSHDGALAFVTCEASAAVAVLDVPRRRALGEIRLPPGSRPMGAALSPDGRRLFVTNGRAGSVSAIDVATRTVAATATGVGARCWGVAVTPDGRKLYVANGPSDDVAVLDATTLSVLKRIPVGTLPWGVAIVAGR